MWTTVTPSSGPPAISPQWTRTSRRSSGRSRHVSIAARSSSGQSASSRSASAIAAGSVAASHVDSSIAASCQPSLVGRASALSSRSWRAATSSGGSCARSCSTSMTAPLASHAARRASGSVSAATTKNPALGLSEIDVKRPKNASSAARSSFGSAASKQYE